MKPPPAFCPNCGCEVPPHARACPECGSDEQTGWSEEAMASGLDLPDDTFDYQEFVEREFGHGSHGSKRRSWFWAVIAAAVLAAFVVWLFRGLR